MRNRNLTVRRIEVAFVACALVSAASLGCRRQPEEPPPPPVTADAPPAEAPVQGLELPLTNPTLGIGVVRTPPGIVATYNHGQWLEFSEEAEPTVRFFVSTDGTRSSAELDGARADFENTIGRYGDGKLLGRGQVEIAGFKPCLWSCGSYSEDGEPIEEVRIFTAHPTRSGVLMVFARYPAGSADTDHRLEQIEQLLGGVS